jgi:hypothetical protein
MLQVTFVVIDHEFLSLLWHVQKLSVKATSTGKLLDSLPRNNAMAELCYGKFHVAYCSDPE